MSWRVITEADVLTVICGPELDGYRAAAKAAGQADPVQPTIDQVTDLVRGYIAARSANELGESGLPSKVISAALDIIAYRIPNRVGSDAGESRRALKDAAIKLLESVADGKFAVEEPSAVTSETFPGSRPSVGGRTTYFDRDSQDGI